MLLSLSLSYFRRVKVVVSTSEFQYTCINAYDERSDERSDGLRKGERRVKRGHRAGRLRISHLGSRTAEAADCRIPPVEDAIRVVRDAGKRNGLSDIKKYIGLT